jgi:exodeoxyribonuclease V alpha subunit
VSALHSPSVVYSPLQLAGILFSHSRGTMEERVVKEVVLDEQQAKGVELCVDLKHRLTAVSGPAGSGKTTLIRLVYDTLIKRGISVALAAPTGKAARRIKEATGIDAVTIHKLLEYNRPGERDAETGKPLDSSKPKRDRQNPLDYTVILVDEYAMVNYELHDNLMAALPSRGCVRAFGDVHQLPPIEKYGNKVYDSRVDSQLTPFQKLLARPGDNIVLERVYRQAEGSNILENADKIRRGHSIPLNIDQGDFWVKLTSLPIPLLKQFIIDNLKAGVDFRQLQNQIITPSKKSWVGTKQLNDVLRTLLNPNPTQVLDLPRHDWDKDNVRVGTGDKVVCTENSYDLRDYFERYSEWDQDQRPVPASYIPAPDNKQMLNGETGIVTTIYPDGALDIDFGDRIVEVPGLISEFWLKRDTVIDVQPARNIDLAYALTTHKCQGSEFEQVVYVINKSTIFAQSRQNFYTAVTRAKKRVVVFSDLVSLRTSLNKVIK